jgi:hypothetical protein
VVATVPYAPIVITVHLSVIDPLPGDPVVPGHASAAPPSGRRSLTSCPDIDVGGPGQTVTVPYDYRHRPVTCLTCASVSVMRMG